jgi:hypothetical protein
MTGHGYSGIAYNSSNNRAEIKEESRKNAGRTKQAGFPPAVDHLSSFPTEILQDQYRNSTGTVQDEYRIQPGYSQHPYTQPEGTPYHP